MKRAIAFLTNIFLTLSATTLLCTATEAVEETTQNEYLAHAEKMLTNPLHMLLIGVVVSGFVAFVILYLVKYRKMK